MKAARLSFALLLLLPAWLGAQQDARRVRAYIDYIAGSSVYLSAGRLQGVFEADTVTAYREGAAAPSGRLIIVSSTRTRAVATYAGETFPLNRGDVLLLEISPLALARLDTLRAQQDTAQRIAAEQKGSIPETPRRRAGRTAHVNGRFGFDVDASQNTTQWGSEPDQRNDITYTSPTLRLHMTASDLPGGVQLTANLRASYYGSSASPERTLSVQAYEASIHTDFGGSPVQLRAGRFYNPFESHSGYWDGGLVRFGPRGFGFGVAAGFEPSYANQSFSTVAPKTTLFIDVHKRNGSLRYDGDVSLHRHTRQIAGDRREFAGVTQRLSIGRTYITQRLQVGKDTSGNAQLWQLQVSASTAVAGPLQVNARYSSDRNDLYVIGPQAATTRVRRTVGVALAGSRGYASVEGGDIDYGGGRKGRTVFLNSLLPRLLAGFGVMVSGSRSSEDTFTSTYASSALDHNLGRALLRAGAHYYRTDFSASLFEQRGGELSLILPLPDRTEITITGSVNRGESNSSNRLFMSLWKSF